MATSMKNAVRRRDACRLCEGKSLELVISLTPTPPANAFVRECDLSVRQERYPLDVYICRGCGHVQLVDVVDPSIMFENYVYVSGTSSVFVEHFRRYAEEMIARYELKKNSLVAEIGSNDGTFLRFFQERGMRAVGVDPAREIARAATEAGVETVPAFFTKKLAEEIRKERGGAALVAANNVFAHADDLKGILEGVRLLLAPEGVFAFEVSYIVDVYRNTLFDTIYHEHLAYHSVRPLQRFFEGNGMELIDAARVEPHGGSLRGVAQLGGGARKVAPRVGELADLEAELGLDRPETFVAFAERIDKLRDGLRELLQSVKAEGKRIAGFGAPAKATTLMYHFGLDADMLDFIVEDNPLKQGMYTPGLHIPVLPSSAIYERKPDYLLVLAWNFARPIIAKHEAFRDGGGKFIVPLPEIEVI